MGLLGRLPGPSALNTIDSALFTAAQKSPIEKNRQAWFHEGSSMKSRALNYIGLIVLSAFAWSCSQKNTITGYWQSPEGSIIEFREDGTFTTHGREHEMTGQYSFVGRGKVKTEMDASNSPVQISPVSIKGDVMTFPNGGFILQLHRVDPSKISTLSPEEEISQREHQWDSPPTNLLRMLRR